MQLKLSADSVCMYVCVCVCVCVWMGVWVGVCVASEHPGNKFLTIEKQSVESRALLGLRWKNKAEGWMVHPGQGQISAKAILYRLNQFHPTGPFFGLQIN